MLSHLTATSGGAGLEDLMQLVQGMSIRECQEGDQSQVAVDTKTLARQQSMYHVSE